MSGTVQFVGQAPYAMPMMQHTKVFSVGDTVEAHIRLLTTPRTLEDAIVTLTANQALVLAGQLSAAASEALAAKRE